MELSIKDIILKNRAYLIGLAMVLVLTYHQLNIGLSMGFATPLFRHLDSSVDIFFYLSALGVSFSYKKNDLKTFYKRRYVRIMPMYFLLVLWRSLYEVIVNDVHLSLWDWFCNFTTLSYYHVGGVPIAWFLAATALFYFIFPILFKIVEKLGHWSVLLFLVLVFVIKLNIEMYWSIDAMISRFPIFILGIVTYLYFNGMVKRNQVILQIIFCLCFALAYKLLPIYMISFAYNACVTPIMIIMLLAIMVIVRKIPYLYPFFEWVGRNSLEFYVANTIVVNCMMIHGFLGDLIVWKYLFYYIAHILIVLIVAPLNKFSCNILKKYLHI